MKKIIGIVPNLSTVHNIKNCLHFVWNKIELCNLIYHKIFNENITKGIVYLNRSYSVLLKSIIFFHNFVQSVDI